MANEPLPRTGAHSSMFLLYYSNASAEEQIHGDISLVGGSSEGPRAGKRAVPGSIPGPRGSVVDGNMSMSEISSTGQVLANTRS